MQAVTVADEPCLPPDEAEGDEDKVPHERVEHQPRWGQLGKVAASELAYVLELRVEQRVVTHRNSGRKNDF